MDKPIRINSKTRVKVKENIHQCSIGKDCIGYIDGYVNGADNRPYAVVVSGSEIDMIPLYNLEAIMEEYSYEGK